MLVRGVFRNEAGIRESRHKCFETRYNRIQKRYWNFVSSYFVLFVLMCVKDHVIVVVIVFGFLLFR